MYKIVGADNKEYGPVSQEEVLQWITHGRANAQTLARLDEGAWKPLGTFDEFTAALNISGTTPPPLTGTYATVSAPPTPAPVAGFPKANSSAITSLVCGILGILCCPCLASVLAIVFGYMGLNQIKANPSAYTTDASLAKIGIGLGIAGLVLAAVQAAWVIFGGGMSILHEMMNSR